MFGGWYIVASRNDKLLGLLIGPVAKRDQLPPYVDGEIRQQIAAANFTVNDTDTIEQAFIVTEKWRPGVLNAVAWIEYTTLPWNMG